MKGVSGENQLVSIDVPDKERVDCATALQPLGIRDDDRVPNWALASISCRRIGESLSPVGVAPLAAVGDDHQVDIGSQIGIGLVNCGVSTSAGSVKPDRAQITCQRV